MDLSFSSTLSTFRKSSLFCSLASVSAHFLARILPKWTQIHQNPLIFSKSPHLWEVTAPWWPNRFQCPDTLALRTRGDLAIPVDIIPFEKRQEIQNRWRKWVSNAFGQFRDARRPTYVADPDYRKERRKKCWVPVEHSEHDYAWVFLINLCELIYKQGKLSHNVIKRT